MSNSYNYNPIPPRVWSRVQNRCTFVDSSNNAYYQSVFIPLPAIPFTQQPMTLAEADYQDKLLYKGNILQYKGNSSQLTKKQKYTQLAKGLGPNRTKVFATQTQTYTNPNTTGLQRVNFTTYPFPNDLVGKPNNISGPFQYDVPNPNGCLNPDGTPSTSLQDGGSLVCGTLANPCTGELIKANNGSAAICNPASASDVPGTSFLCWNRRVQTWFPRQRYVMPNSGTKWPEGYKGLVSAVVPTPPVLTLDSYTSTTASISWVDASGVCFDISSYRIYLNDQLYTTVPYPIRSYTLYNLSECSNSIYVTSVLSGTESVSSNVVVISFINTFVASGTYTSTVDASNNYTVLFTSAGEITFGSLVSNLQVILIGGGGGGAKNTSNTHAGGGGGGGQAVIPFSVPNLSCKTFKIKEIGSGGSGGTSSISHGNNGTQTSFADPNNITYTVLGGYRGSPSSDVIGFGGMYTGPHTTSYGETVSLHGSGGNGGIGKITGGPTNGSNSYLKTISYFLINSYALGGGGGGSGDTGGEGGSCLNSGNGVGGGFSNSVNLDTQDALGYGAGGGAYNYSVNPPNRGGNGSPGVCIFYFHVS
jgi:hypothetical protein